MTENEVKAIRWMKCVKDDAVRRKEMPMNKTKIEWCDSTWNPVTGCLHACEYCYARRIAERFGGWSTGGVKTKENFVKQEPPELDKPLLVQRKNGKAVNAPFPFGFSPTLHRYRMGEPIAKKTGQTIFVCSMADLFGSWVPDSWIEEVFAACMSAPQNRYLFLTKNHQRYLDLAAAEKLPFNDNMWYGTTVTSPNDMFFFSEAHHTFISIEPMMERLFAEADISKLVNWIIIGAMTGSGSSRHQPKREWIEEVVSSADSAGVPVFMTDSLIPIIGEEKMRRDFPWKEM